MRAQPATDRYKIIKRLHYGPDSSVYLADDLERLARVILKTAHPSIHGEAALERLPHEFMVLYNLHHPNIVRVLDFSRSATLGTFFSMEDSSGSTLAALNDSLSLN